jgi:hypothetical protein
MTLTPGPDGLEKVVWSRSSKGVSDRTFEMPCSGEALANRNGERDDQTPFTCGTYARRSVIKHFLREVYGGSKYNEGARSAVVRQIQELVNSTLQAWSFDQNFLCTCPNGSATGWECCTEQANCATEPCPCPDGFAVPASVACCDSVCGGLAGNGIMMPFSYIKGEQLAESLLASMGAYLRNDIWISNDPWLKQDPLGADAYRESWNRSQFDVADAGLFDAAEPVVYYDEIAYPFKSTFWAHCTGLLQQVIWTMPMDRKTGKPKGMGGAFDPINGQSMTPNMTYTEDFVKSLTLESYKASPIYWHYNVRHTPSQSEVCRRTAPRPPLKAATFKVGSSNAARQFGFSAMTLGGLGGADCFCGWWDAETACRIPDAVCAALVQIVGFTRICLHQQQAYNASDHAFVLSSLRTLLARQPNTDIPCPLLQISDHWGFLDTSDGRPWPDVTDVLLNEGANGFRVGNIDWLFAAQAQLLNPGTRSEPMETPSLNVALECNATASPSLADLFVDDLFPSAQGVRQSMPQSYCTRYGIELARLTVYDASGLTDAVSQQQGVVNKWKTRCQYKLEELAVCNSFRIYNATGGPTSTAQCPFSLAVAKALQASYAITPGCLLVLWNTPGRKQDGIYDPCVCVPCTHTPTIDVPAQLTTRCLLEAFQSLVARDVIPGESAVPLGSGSFRSLMDKPGFLQINTPDITHWALHTGIRDADLISDWWPDEWRYPAGYHVTPGCSRPGDARWRTFDASWRWDSAAERMVLAKDEVNDPSLSRNAFGAYGVCRTNNYGMPMTGLNTMAVCTRENPGARADPMVPAPPKAAAWSDGDEHCAPDAFSTPWDVDRALNPPRQWAVGSLQHKGVLAPFKATEWGASCGPYPLQTCVVDRDCAAGSKCVSRAGAGVCSNLQDDKFQCTSHAQCDNDRMCAGDGLCVHGVWQIKNEISVPVSFRTYSQNCLTGNALDTWGTSIAETVPDILNASGLCSYRSWFENRRMATRNACNRSDTCAAFDGMQPWNFSSPYMKDAAGESAFDSNVLKVLAHPCDRDYQYLQNFVSCTPGDVFAAMFDASGNPSGVTSIPRDNRTITYRVGKRLPLIHHMDGNFGPTFGFTGIPLTYSKLKLGTDTPSIIPCAAQKVCSLQPGNSFKVNQRLIDKRLVLDSMGNPRGYTINDLLACGVFGSLVPGGVCALDYAIVPLAKVVLDGKLFSIRQIPKFTFTYAPSSTKNMLAILQGLPAGIIQYYIGGQPTTLQDYVQKSARFAALYATMAKIEKPTYAEAGTPNQLYYITQYGALEVPFAWWYKCNWLSNIPMGVDVVDDSQCHWNPPGTTAARPVVFGPYDKRYASLFNLAAPLAETRDTGTLLDALIRLPGVVTQTILDQAKTEFTSQRNAMGQNASPLLRRIQKRCYQQREYIDEFSDVSEEYQAQRLAQMDNKHPFDLTKTYLNDATGAVLCTGNACLRSEGYAVPVTSNADFANEVLTAMQGTVIKENTIPLDGTTASSSPDSVGIQGLYTSEQIADLFWTSLNHPFQNQPSTPCALVNRQTPNMPKFECLCVTWTACSKSVLDLMLDIAGISAQPAQSTPALLQLGDVKLDVCKELGATRDGVCYLNRETMNKAPEFSDVNYVNVPTGTAVELYTESSWSCRRLTCGEHAKHLDGVKVPDGFEPYTISTSETVVVDEYEFTQAIPASVNYNRWPDAATEARERACNENPYRYREVKKSEQFRAYFVCEPTCTIPGRPNPGSLNLKLKTKNVSYYVNDTLVASVEYFPCIPDSARFIVMALQTMHTYKPDNANFKPTECNSVYDANTGLPLVGSFDDGYIRKVELSAGQSDRAGILARMRDVVAKLTGAASKSACMSTNQDCPYVDGVYRGSLKSVAWTGSSKRNRYCGLLKTDMYFGCSMYPGEITDNRHFNKYMDIWGDVCPGTYPRENAYNEIQYYQCIIDSSDDPCKNAQVHNYDDDSDNGYAEGKLRDMKLSGRSLVYTRSSTIPVCTTSELMNCWLVDEHRRLGSKGNITGCPGTNASSARYRDYSKLNGYPTTRLYTDFQRPYQMLNGDSLTENTFTGAFFHHMYVGLNQGYRCCVGCDARAICLQPPVVANPQIALEMRAGLWKCLNCPTVSSIHCKGLHNCLLTSPELPVEVLQLLDGWTLLPAAQQSFLLRNDSAIDVAAPAVKWLVTNAFGLWVSDVRLSYDLPPFMTSFDTAQPYVFNPVGILAYDAAMQLSAQTCKVSGKYPDFTNCSYDGRRRNLRRFISANYKTSDGAIIPPQQTLQWKVRRTQMITQNIPQWEAVLRNRSGLFLRDLLDDRWCLKGSMVDNACYVRTDAEGQIQVDVLNPSLLGAFEPSRGCDTAIVNQQRVISAVCGDCDSPYPNEYTTMEDDVPMPCPQTSDVLQRVTIDNAAASNLCSKTPGVASSCSNLRGMLSQTDYDGGPMANLYVRNQWTENQPPSVSANLLFQGKANAGISNLILSPEDIGGHFVRMVLSQTRSGAYVMAVQGLPLLSYADPLSPSAYALGVSGSNMRWTQVNAASEADRLRKLYPNSVCAAWDCPLRRRAFWMGQDDTFRPRVPDPLRAEVLYGRRAHPTQAAFALPTLIAQTPARVLGVYASSNGFCACLAPPCTACPLDTPALTGTWTESSVLTAQSACKEQLDWPYAGGSLRDGSILQERWNLTTPCGVLDRLPVFQYRYRNLQRTQPSTKTTLDRGGVCHMGWPAVTAGPLAGCYILVDQDAYMCPSYSQPKAVPRLRAKTIPELLTSPTRPRLADCSPPPTYAFGNGTETPPEVSYGQLKRWEASRMLASDLRRRLCGDRKDCAPASQWSLPTFWTSVYMAHFPPIPDGNGENQTLWNQPWVGCTQEPNGTQTCEGVIDRRTWATGDRVQVCLSTLTKLPIASKLVQDVNVCDLDATMDKFCRTVQDGRYRIFEANCQYSGNCRPKLFFYQPSTYEISNAQFVRSTVQTFYNSTVAGACMPDQDTMAQILINAQNLDKCAATQLNVVVNCIQIVRVIVSTLVELMYYVGQIGLFVLQLIGTTAPADKDQISQQISAVFALIQNKFLLFMQEVGDLFYTIFTQGPIGEWLLGIIQAICEFVSWLFSDVVYVVFCFVNRVSILFLRTYATVIVTILDGIAFGKLGYLHNGIQEAIDSIEHNIPCTPKNLWPCNFAPPKKNSTVTTLPMPTRCWAGAEPGPNSLACTAADTCIQQSDFSKIVCGACPAASSMTRFGCDTLTKLCSCNIFPVGITSCASHQECRLDNSDVSCRYVDSYLQPSYGNVPCQQCPKPMCLIIDGSGVGQCSCLLRPVPSQTCSGVGDRVSPDATALCLVASEGSSQTSSSNAYTVDYRTLLSAPCMLLNQGSTYCMKVYTSGTVNSQMVVGLSLLKTGRRRLLAWENASHFDSTNDTIALASNTSVWEGRGEPCRTIVLADLAELGLLEKYTRSECWRWYEIGVRLTTEANMTHAVSPFLLVSWSDLLHTMLDRGALVEIMAKMSFVVNRLLFHSELTQPVYLMVSYWLKIIPEEAWTNQTFLDHANEFLHNASTLQFHHDPSRRLLFSVEEPHRTADRTLLATVINTEVSSQTVYEWGQGPYAWPPNFVYWDGDNSCAVVSTAISVVKNGLDATIKFYQEPLSDPLPVVWPTLPVRMLNGSNFSLPASFDLMSVEGLSAAARDVLSAVTSPWLDEDAIRAFLTNAPYMSTVKGLVQCNFARVQTCTDRRSFFWSALQTLVVVIGLAVALKALQLPYAEVILFVFTVPVFMYVTYGYSPTCTPLIPTCLLRDLFDLLDWFLPESVEWPPSLVTRPGCTSVSCMRSCTDDPLVGFANYNDHAAWVMCEIHRQWAIDTAFSMAGGNAIRMSILRKCMDVDAWSAQRICFAITVVNSLPLLVLAFVVLWTVPVVCGVVLSGVQFVVNLAFTFVLFVNAGQE